METLDELLSKVDGKLILEINVHCHHGDYWSFSATANSSSGGKALYHRVGFPNVEALKGAIQDFLIEVYRDGKKAPKQKVKKAAPLEDDFLA
jgi:hypothetical protein